MKKIITILLIFAAIAVKSQSVKSDKIAFLELDSLIYSFASGQEDTLIAVHPDSSGQYLFKNMADPVNDLDGVNFRTLVNSGVVRWDSLYFDADTGILTAYIGGSVVDSTDMDGRYVLYSDSTVIFVTPTQLSTALSGVGDMQTSVYDTANISEQLVGIYASQTLANKTLTQPTIANYTNATHDHSTNAQGGVLSSDDITEGMTNKFSQWTLSGGNIYRATGNVGIGGSPTYLLDIFGTTRTSILNISSSLQLDGLVITDISTGTLNNNTLTTKGYVDDAISAGGGYTDSDAQNAVGGILDDGTLGDIDFTYVTTTSISGDVEDDSHNHTATTISGLTTADFTSDAISQWDNDANYVTNTYVLTNDLSGTLNNPSVVDDSHNHVITNVDNLQDSLDVKLNTVATDETLNGLGTAASELKIDTSIIATNTAIVDSLVDIVDSIAIISTRTLINEDSIIDISARSIQNETDIASLSTSSHPAATLTTSDSDILSLNTSTQAFDFDDNNLPKLDEVNTFTANQNISGDLDVTGSGSFGDGLSVADDGIGDLATPIIYLKDGNGTDLGYYGIGSSSNSNVLNLNLSAGDVELYPLNGSSVLRESGNVRLTTNPNGVIINGNLGVDNISAITQHFDGVGNVSWAGSGEYNNFYKGTILSFATNSADQPTYYANRRSRGSIETPLALQQNDIIGMMAAEGHDGTGFVYSGDARFIVDGAVSSGIVPSRFVVTLQPTTGGSRVERFAVLADGMVGINTTTALTDKILHAKGSARIGSGNSQDTIPSLVLDGLATSNARSYAGNYGGLIFDASSSQTSSARRYLLTNAYETNKFAIIRSTDANTDPSLGDLGAVSSGIVDFSIDNTGNATFSGDLDVTGKATAGAAATADNDLLRLGEAKTLIGDTATVLRSEIQAASHNPVTLNASATSGGLSLATQEISFRAATNSQTGYATATHISNIEANNAKVTNATHTGDVTGSTSLSIAANVIVDADINSAANITATKLGTGVVDNTEFNTLNGIDSNIQDQLNAIIASLHQDSDKEPLSGTKNGINVTFTITNTPISGSDHLFLNGQLLKGGGTDYTLTGTTVTMTVAPESDDWLIMTYRY